MKKSSKENKKNKNIDNVNKIKRNKLNGKLVEEDKNKTKTIELNMGFIILKIMVVILLGLLIITLTVKTTITKIGTKSVGGGVENVEDDLQGSMFLDDVGFWCVLFNEGNFISYLLDCYNTSPSLVGFAFAELGTSSETLDFTGLSLPQLIYKINYGIEEGYYGDVGSTGLVCFYTKDGTFLTYSDYSEDEAADILTSKRGYAIEIEFSVLFASDSYYNNLADWSSYTQIGTSRTSENVFAVRTRHRR